MDTLAQVVVCSSPCNKDRKGVDVVEVVGGIGRAFAVVIIWGVGGGESSEASTIEY